MDAIYVQFTRWNVFEQLQCYYYYFYYRFRMKKPRYPSTSLDWSWTVYWKPTSPAPTNRRKALKANFRRITMMWKKIIRSSISRGSLKNGMTWTRIRFATGRLFSTTSRKRKTTKGSEPSRKYQLTKVTNNITFAVIDSNITLLHPAGLSQGALFIDSAHYCTYKLTFDSCGSYFPMIILMGGENNVVLENRIDLIL